MSNLLINESPLQVLPTLATYIGLNEAIFLQQVHYWLRIDKVGRWPTAVNTSATPCQIGASSSRLVRERHPSHDQQSGR